MGSHMSDINLSFVQIFHLLQILKNATLFNTLKAELNLICQLLALLGARHILHVSMIRVNTSLQDKETYSRY